MKKYQLIDRAQFVTARYENFLKMKTWLESKNCPYPPGSYHLTDLDRVYDNQTKPQKDIVICDRCNEDINDVAFVMVEGSYTYHRDCIRNELPNNFGQSIENVIFINFYNSSG